MLTVNCLVVTHRHRSASILQHPGRALQIYIRTTLRLRISLHEAAHNRTLTAMQAGPGSGVQAYGMGVVITARSLEAQGSACDTAAATDRQMVGGYVCLQGLPLGQYGGDKKGGNAEITPLQVDPSVSFDAVGGLDHYIRVSGAPQLR